MGDILQSCPDPKVRTHYHRDGPDRPPPDHPMALPNTRTELEERWQSGEAFELFHFYGHKPPESGVDASCLSQWFVRPFTIDDVEYPTAEHWMMAEKARLFDDHDMLKEILASPGPREAKAFGRKVSGFDHVRWNEQRIAVVERGNLAKFSQHEDLKAFLLGTSGPDAASKKSAPSVILVEAAGRDQIWGIGLSASNPKADDPSTWRGMNLLGFALTSVREQLAG